MALIYHITPRIEWKNAQTTGPYTADSLSTQGFIHASTREQVVGTGNYLFLGQKDLVLLCIDTERLDSELRYEFAPGTDQKFPHIYGPLNLNAVIDVVDFIPGTDGKFSLPVRLP